MKERSAYDIQADQFLADHHMRLRATYKGDKCPPWCGEDDRGCAHGDRYRITIWRPGQTGRLSFDFWNSQADQADGIAPTAYSVLACISSDAYSPDTFEEFCGDYGYDEDSRRALQTFRRLDQFARRLREFFTEDELEALAEIR